LHVDCEEQMKPVFFRTPADFRAWLEEHHADETELWVGFSKKGTGKQSITWPEAVDQALCFGWIDGIRKSVDEESYANRFTPRRPRSNWSAVNIKRVQVLTELGLMRPEGLAVFEQSTDDRSGTYSFEQQGAVELGEEFEGLFRANPVAWDDFQSRPAGYRRTATWWVMSAKKDETRRKRLATLIEDSAQGRPIKLLARDRSR
jgi:uncharacterized protein YdeI (YjbR/CyaY-like superfamily)